MTLGDRGFFGKIVVFKAKTMICPGFSVFDCRFSIGLLNFSGFMAQFGLVEDVLGSLLPVSGLLLGGEFIAVFGGRY